MSTGLYGDCKVTQIKNMKPFDPLVDPRKQKRLIREKKLKRIFNE